MSQKLVIPTTTKIEQIYPYVDGIIFGIKGMCVNCLEVDYSDSIELIKDIKNHNKKVFIFLNKNMHNSDLLHLEEILIELSKYDIDGVFYADVAVINIYNRLDLNYDLIWSSEHVTTNYSTINYWNNIGTKGTFISNEITLDEIIEIRNNTNSKLFVQVFGYMPIYVSMRHAVKNYLEHFAMSDNSEINYISKEGNTYPIIDNETGTMVYSSNILNALEESLEFDTKGIDYLILNMFNIDTDKQNKVLKIYNTVTTNNVSEYNKEICSLFDNIDKGFLYRKTVFKVKKNA